MDGFTKEEKEILLNYIKKTMGKNPFVKEITKK